DLRLGMRSEVMIGRTGELWLPLFRPSRGGVGPAEFPAGEFEPAAAHEHIRPMPKQEKFEDKVALTGIGMSRIGRRLMTDPLALTLEACRAAVADAGLELDDIDGLSTYPGAGSLGPFTEGGVTAVESALGLRPSWFNGGAETFGPGGSLIAAMLAVAGGLARHVLC